MTELILTRGVPGSGKSTWALSWVAEDPTQRSRCNRDDLRQALYGRYAGLSGDAEKAVTVAQKATVRALLRSGRSVVVDDTNLYMPAARDWADIAVEEGAEFWVKEFDVPLDVCLARNAVRERVVPESVIRKMHDKFVNRKVIESRLSDVERYVPDESLLKAFVVDIDGTLARHVSRSPYDYTRVSTDEVIEPVAQMVRDLYSSDSEYFIIIMSGREDSCRSDTIEWLNNFEVPFHEIYMRSTGDQRKDSVIKAELFDKVRNRYNVVGWIDDREQVVQMVRDRLGITVYQVDWGRF